MDSCVEKYKARRDARLEARKSGCDRNDYGVPGMKWGEHKSSEEESSQKKNIKAIKKSGKGTISANDVGFDEISCSKAIKKYQSEHGIDYMTGDDKQKAVNEYVKSVGLPNHVKSDNCDYEIDHYDYVGGHFSYSGKADGFEIGKEYQIPGQKEGTKGKAVAIHVYPNGSGEVHFNYKDKYGISSNYKHKF